MHVKTGSFVGNGTSQTIPLDFDPVFVHLHTQNQNMVWTSSAMSANSSKPIGTGALIAGAITSLNADGFSVGSSALANANGATIYYTALGGTENIDVGTYTGNDVDNRNIPTDIDPDFVWVWRTADNPQWRSESTNGSYIFENLFSSALVGDAIQALGVGSFQVGTHQHVNDNGVTYYYLALKRQVGRFIDLTYTGTGEDGLSISGFGLQPTLCFVERLNPDNGGSCIRYGAQVGDVSFTVGGSSNSNYIQAFEADGIDLGTDARVNANTDNYGVFAFADGLDSVTPVVDDVQPRQFANGDLVEITGSNFGAAQGNGKVELGDNHEYNAANKKQQVIDHWEDLAIRFIADRGTIPPGQVFVFVTNDDAETNDPPPPDDPEDLDTEVIGFVVSGSGGSGYSTEKRLEIIYAAVSEHTAPGGAGRSKEFLMKRIGAALGINITSGMRSFESNLILMHNAMTDSVYTGNRDVNSILSTIESQL